MFHPLRIMDFIRFKIITQLSFKIEHSVSIFFHSLDPCPLELHGYGNEECCTFNTFEEFGAQHSGFRLIYSTDEMYLNVEGEGIETKDKFCFYVPNVEVAQASHNAVREQLRVLRQKGSEDCCPINMRNGSETLVFGGLVFACTARRAPFFGEKNVDSSEFSDFFPGVPLARTFSEGKIGPAA
ncbi:hypothetical protein AMTR_s00013p00143500 [Amborella trichopoda]|uniref:Uncharacterized protein n=1 Tax=Amborella trichopoda TaxID=13333 RepID=W1PQ94_AMBTC|nr:hypothetical protein AMTR_s00013p00143500 [Amborella trichopoda]